MAKPKKKPTATEARVPKGRPSPSSKQGKKPDSGGSTGARKRVPPKDRPHRERKRKGPRCAFIKANGQQCLGAPIKGGRTCHKHGSGTKLAREAAARRLQDAVLPALKELRKIIDSKRSSDADKLKAIGMVLNRTGFSERSALDISLREPTQWELLQAQMGEELVIGFDRASLDVSDDDDERPALGSGGEGDAELDAQLEALLAERDRRREREAATRLDNSGHDVIAAEIPDEAPRTSRARRAERAEDG